MNIGQGEKALEVVAYVRQRDVQDELVQIEYLEIKAEAMFDTEILERRYPRLVGRGGISEIKIELYQMATLVTDWSIFKRTAAGCLTMVRVFPGCIILLFLSQLPYVPFPCFS